MTSSTSCPLLKNRLFDHLASYGLGGVVPRIPIPFPVMMLFAAIEKKKKSGRSGSSSEIPITGSVEIDFDAVAAPVLSDDTPPPGSTDPRAPGVLVISHGDLDGAGPGAVLVVGTSSNLYPVRERIEGDPEGGEIFHMVTDGAGIGLFVDRSRPGCFCGSWDRWGIVGAGSGSYCAYHLSDGPSGAGG
jgi:hypothetical protein